MNCPVCDAQLRTVNKHNIEVEICPDCKGVWLDRGELDKIIEIASGDATEPRVEESREPRGHREEDRHEHDRDRDRDRDERKHDDHGHRGKEEYDSRTGKPRKKSMLGEIFGMIGGED